MSYHASMIATVGARRYEYQSSDTCKTHNSMPLIKFTDIDDLITHLPYGCELVGVELSDRAKELTRFRHPDRALYLLGAEDRGIPDDVLAKCHHVVQIPSPVSWSLNVSVAGSLVLHDRYLKTARTNGAAA
jgi:tRNA G18 (ribose-2'-O)-methylase SpoU